MTPTTRCTFFKEGKQTQLLRALQPILTRDLPPFSLLDTTASLILQDQARFIFLHSFLKGHVSQKDLFPNNI